MMETTAQFLNMTDTLNSGLAACGAKAYNLARVEKMGFNIPKGFVIPCHLVASTDNEVLAKEVFEILKSVSPGPWAVRSSGIAEDGNELSFAGQFASILNVQDENTLKDAIDNCICSASSAQVASYGKEETQPIALLVQQMVNADYAGVAFSANPITGERSEVLINAVIGLGDKLVSGEVTPCEYVVKNGTLQKRKKSAQVLTEKQAALIAETAKQLEANFGKPQDIEWAIENEKLFILQSRPITALPPQPVPIPLEIPKGTWKRDDHHTTLSPMAYTTFMERYMNGMKKYFRKYGFPIKEMQAKMIGGHLYGQMLMEGGDQKGTPPNWVLWLASRLLPPIRKMNKTMKTIFEQKLHHQEMQLWNDKGQPYFESKNAAFARTDLTKLSHKALLERWHEVRKHLYDGIDAHADRMGSFLAMGEFFLFGKDHLGWDNDKFFRITAGWSSASSFLHDSLTDLCKSHFSSKALSEDKSLPGGIHTFFTKNADFKNSVDAWIKENALRMQDYDLINPTLGEKPEMIYQNVHAILKEMAANPNHLSKTGKNPEREASFADARQKFAGSHLLNEFEELAKWCEVAYSQRDENGLLTVAQTCALVRLQLLEMAKRMELKNPEHIFFLKEDEVEDAFHGRLDKRDELILHRMGEKQWAVFNRGPKRYGDPEPPMPSPDPFPEAIRKAFQIFGWIDEVEMGEHHLEESSDENRLIGRAASAGVYKGKAKIIRSPKDFNKLEAGDVMVCRITSGEWSMVFSRVGALVSEEGGLLSHPAIIAREFGIPAVVGTEIAMEKIVDGMEISVDGNKGIVYI